MEANSDSQKDAQQGDKNPLPVSHPAPAQPPEPTVNRAAPPEIQQNVGTDPQAKKGEQKPREDRGPLPIRVIEDDELSTFERRTVRLGYWGVVIGSLSLLAACVAGFLVYHQWWEMNSQTGYMNRAAIEARIDSAKNTLIVQQQLKIAQDQATAAQKQVSAVTRQMRQDQRAWIKVTAYGPKELPAPDAPIFGKIAFENMGKTPAKNVTGKAEIEVVDSTRSPSFKYHRGFPYLAAGYMFPTIPGEGPINLGDDPRKPRAFTKKERESLQKGDAYLAIYGTISYADMFGVHHWVRFCQWFVYLQGTQDYAARACANYGKVDDQ